MTCREKLMQERPDLVDELRYSGGCCGCPSMRGYLPDPEECGTKVMGDRDCRECWDREIPKQPSSAEFLNKTMHIKDSGDRTLFDTGAVRDMREGKGRCDLMPLEVLCHAITDRPELEEGVIGCIRNFKITGNTDHLYEAISTFCVSAYENNRYTMFLEVAKHFEEGAKKYGDNNWQKGIPVHCYIDSAVRHYLKWLRGDKDEPHDRAFVWNLMCCIWEVDYHTEDRMSDDVGASATRKEESK